jgi:LmbE family N-acetylglucosaminyl deacetylase
MQRVAILPDGSAPRRILALGAHADDIEIGCGGTLLRLLAERPGTVVHWVVFCATPEREREARASAAAFLDRAGDVAVEVLGFRDGFLPYSGAGVKEAFEAVKGRFAPDLVLTHHRHDLHQDHRLVSELTWNTWRDHLVLEYEIPKYDGDLGSPNLFCPLPVATLERKVALVLEHFRSQAGKHWFTPELLRALPRIRGMECVAPDGVAEAFYCRKAVF